MEPKVQRTLDQPGCRDRLRRVSMPQRPHGHDDHRREKATDIADEMFVVEVAGAGDPVSSEGEIVEERSWRERRLNGSGCHEQGDQT